MRDATRRYSGQIVLKAVQAPNRKHCRQYLHMQLLIRLLPGVLYQWKKAYAKSLWSNNAWFGPNEKTVKEKEKKLSGSLRESQRRFGTLLLLENMSLSDYGIRKGRKGTFCYMVEIALKDAGYPLYGYLLKHYRPLFIALLSGEVLWSFWVKAFQGLNVCAQITYA